MKNWYFIAFVVLGILFIVAAGFLLRDLQNILDSSLPTEMPGDVNTLTASAALITAVASLLGAILTFVLSWRQEQRKQRIAEMTLERERLALEKEKLALEQLRHEIEQKKENASDA